MERTLVSKWPSILREVASLGPYSDMGALVAEVQRHKPGASYDALQKAAKRYASWAPMDLVGDVAGEWDEEPMTVPDSGIANDLPEDLGPITRQKPMFENVWPDFSPRFSLNPGDIHCPIWDRDLVFAVLDFAEWWGIDHLNIGGDLLDLYGASRFSKSGRRLMAGHGSLVNELRAVTGFYERATQIFKHITYLLGNHEGRAAERFVDENLWLYDHGAFDPRALFEVPDNWHLYDPGTRLRIGSVCFAHGHKLKGSGAAHSAANVLKWNPMQHTVYGHTHRAQQASHVVYDAAGQPQTFTATSCGHLSQLEYHNDYATQPAWEHAFAVVEHGPDPQVHLIRIQNRKWRWMGREWGPGL